MADIVDIDDLEPLLPATSPLHPLLAEALRRGLALDVHHGALLLFACRIRCLARLKEWELDDGGSSPVLSFLEKVAFHEVDSDGLPNLDWDLLAEGTDAILGQLAVVWDFGTALWALHEQQSRDPPGFVTAVDVLTSERPASYLSFAMRVARMGTRDELARLDLDPVELVLREEKKWYPPRAPRVPYRGLDVKRLWRWARICERYDHDRVLHPGMDEGKLVLLLDCPRPVIRALLPLLPAMDHARAASLTCEIPHEWWSKAHAYEKKLGRQLARRTLREAMLPGTADKDLLRSPPEAPPPALSH